MAPAYSSESESEDSDIHGHLEHCKSDTFNFARTNINTPYAGNESDSIDDNSGSDDDATPAAIPQPRGKTFPPPVTGNSSSDEDELVNETHTSVVSNAQFVRPNPVAPRGKELRLTKEVMGAETSSEEESSAPVVKRTRTPSKKAAANIAKNTKSAAPKKKASASSKKKSPPKNDDSKTTAKTKPKSKAPPAGSKKRKEPPLPAPSDSDSDSDDDVVAAVVVEGSDSEHEVLAVAEPIKSDKKMKAKGGTTQKAKSKAAPAKADVTKSARKKPGPKPKSAVNSCSISSVIPLPAPERVAAAKIAREQLRETVAYLPFATSDAHVVRSFGRINPECGVSALNAMYSSPHTIFPVGFSCDRFEFSPVHGRMIKMRCDILDGKVLRMQQEAMKKQQATKPHKGNGKTEPSLIEEAGYYTNGNYDGTDSFGDGPVFRIVWGEGIENEELLKPSYSFDPYAVYNRPGDDAEVLTAHVLSEGVKLGSPEVGMRVIVRFDEGKMYEGTVMKASLVEEQSGKQITHKKSWKISILYDDGVFEETTFPDPDIYLLPPGCVQWEQGNGLVEEMCGKPVHSVLAKTPLEAWGKTLISLGLIDEVIYDAALKSLHKTREDGLAEAREKIDLANKIRREARAKEKKRLCKDGEQEENEKKGEVEVDAKSKSETSEDESEAPSLHEIELRMKLTELEGVLLAAKRQSKAACENLTSVRISTLSPFASNPFFCNEESHSQEMNWLSAAVKKERSRMGYTGNRRKIVTPASILDKCDTYFTTEIEKLVEGLPGSEFTPAYVFHSNRTAAASNYSWVHETKVRQQKELNKKMEKERKIAEEAQAKAEIEREKERKRKLKQEESDKRKRLKEEEEELKKKERVEKRLAQLGLQMDERLSKESYNVRERNIVNFARSMTKEFNRRRRAAEIAVAHKVDSPSVSSHLNTSTSLPPFREMLPPLSREYDEDIVRLWDFINSFQDAFYGNNPDASPPSIEKLQDAIDCLNDPKEEKRFNSVELLSNIAINLCKVISPTLTKSLASGPQIINDGNGVKASSDSAKEATNVSLPVTEHTWREIARMVIIFDVLLDLGYSKQESSNIIKGVRSGGHPNSKEAKRLKKVEDSPLLMMYQQLDLKEEPLSSQYRRRVVLANLSIPSSPSCPPSDWRFYLHNIQTHASNSSCFIRDSIVKSLNALRSSSNAVVDSDKFESYTNNLEKCLSILKQEGSESAGVAETMRIVQKILNSTTPDGPTWLSTPNSSNAISSAVRRNLFQPPPRQRMGFLNLYKLSRDKYKSLDQSREDYMAAALRLKEELERKNNDGTNEDDDDDDDDEEEEEGASERHQTNASVKENSTENKLDRTNPSQSFAFDEVATQVFTNDETESAQRKVHSRGETNASSPSVTLDKSNRSEEKPVNNETESMTEKSSKEGSKNTAVDETEVCGTKTDYDFCEDVSHAPDLIRRCLAVIRTLCASNSSDPFIYPVDPQLYPGYYEAVMAPTSLYDIGSFLQESGKRLNANDHMQEIENVVSEVGRRVRIIIQNSLCYSSGYNTVNSAEEMIRIFERLFFDWVLAPSNQRPALKDLDDDRCIDHHESDLTSMVLLCDGCEGKYNMSRLKPPLSKVPSGDWYCPRCVSCRCWGSVDPRIGRRVLTTSLSGTVESCKFVFSESGEASLVYAIKPLDSGLTEYWDLDDVDKSIVGEPVEPISCLQALAESPGYGFGRDYGTIHSALPLVMNPLVGESAAQAFLSSSAFRDTVSSCIYLINSPDEMKSGEWMTLLSLLTRKCSACDAIQELSSNLENKAAGQHSSRVSEFYKTRGAKDIPDLSDDESASSVDDFNGRTEFNDKGPEEGIEPKACNLSNDGASCNENSMDTERIPDGSSGFTEEGMKHIANCPSVMQEEILRKNRETAFLTRSRREKKREEALMGFYVENRLKSTAASFEEDFLSPIVKASFCTQEDGLNIASVRCKETCYYCGLSDVALGAPLCRVPNEDEWLEEFTHASHDRTTYMVAEVSESSSKQANSINADYSVHRDNKTDTPKRFFAVRVRVHGKLISSAADTIDSPSKNFNSSMQHFLPRNSRGFQAELNFRHESKMLFNCGSLTAHEVCAVSAHRSRKSKYLLERRRWHEANIGRELAISCGKSTPLGTDLYGRTYWVFSSEPKSLFVCGTNTSTLERKGKVWYRFHEPEEIASIMVCLGKEPPCDILKEIFTEAYEVVQDKSWRSLLMLRSHSSSPHQRKSITPAKQSATKDSGEEDLGPPFVEDENVLVESTNGRMLWDAVVIKVHKDRNSEIVNGYFVHYRNWSSRFDQWVHPERVVEPSKNNLIVQTEVLEEFSLNQQVKPRSLEGLNAFKFLSAKNRANSTVPAFPPEIFDCTHVRPSASYDEKLLGILKGSLLLIEAALPFGSLIPSELGSWNSQSVAIWRYMVKHSLGPETLMKCVLVLEDAISPDWLLPQVSYMLSAVARPWRAICEASLPAIALRISLLDDGLCYGTVKGRRGYRS
mmetsp:Transcript_26902/g.55459  ORF Transcript_26902/g.55459 Transcript_26902/m.55459 type:complete len:2488 (+) Transcript_26902:443-7906(+)